MSEKKYEITDNKLAIELLRQGKKVMIKLQGGSMFPCLRHNDMAVIKPVTEILRRGDIVAYISGNSIVLHRIIKIDGNLAICKGDSNQSADAALEMKQIEGKLELIIRKKKFKVDCNSFSFKFWKMVVQNAPWFPVIAKKIYLYVKHYGRKTA